MIYEIDLILCAISAFFFKNIFTFALFLLAAYFLFKYVIQKFSNITVILYILFMICIFAGGVVLSLIPSKEDILCPIMINSYYIGPLTFAIFIALIVSIIVDLISMLCNKNKDKNKKEEKTIKTKKNVKKIKKKIIKE